MDNQVITPEDKSPSLQLGRNKDILLTSALIEHKRPPS